MADYLKVKICGVPYSLRRETEALFVDHSGEGAQLWGQISYSKHSIRCLASSPEQELRTILHEILHGIVEQGAVRELMSEKGVHYEHPINQLANGLAEALESLGITVLAPSPKLSPGGI